MSTAVQKLLDIAKAEVGYREKTATDDLYNKTASSGEGNYTKYTKELSDAKFFGGTTSQGAWCDNFVCWCFFKAFGAEAAKQLICGGSPSCPTHIAQYKAKDQFVTSPQPGDQIFYNRVGTAAPDHTGLVYKVDSYKVYTVEGNTTGGKVAEREHSLTDATILGYGRPDFLKVLGENYSYNGTGGVGSGNYTWVFTGSSDESEIVTQYSSQSSLYSVLDVSSYQRNLNWDVIKGIKPADIAGRQPKPVAAAIIKAGQGTTGITDTWIDSLASYHIQGCVKNKIPFGLYWFATGYNSGDPSGSGRRIAESIYTFYQNLSPEARALCTFPLFIDIEESTVNRTNELAAAYAFCKEILRCGCVPGVYASAGRLNSWINDLSKQLDSTIVDFSYTDTTGALNKISIYKGDLMYCKWIAEWKCGVNSTFNFSSYKINPPIGLWQQWGDIKTVPGKMYVQGTGYTSNIDVNNCFIDYANAGMYSEPAAITELQEGVDYVLFAKTTTDENENKKSKITYATYNVTSQFNPPVLNKNTTCEYIEKALSATTDINSVMNSGYIFNVKKVPTLSNSYYICKKGTSECLAIDVEEYVVGPDGPMKPGSRTANLCFKVLPDVSAGADIDWSCCATLKNGEFEFLDKVGGSNWTIRLEAGFDASGNDYITASASAPGIVALSNLPKKISTSGTGNGGDGTGSTYGWDASSIAAALLAADDSASRESIYSCLNTYAEIDLNDYADFNDNLFNAEYYTTANEMCSVDVFENYLEALRGLLSHSPISSVSAQTEIGNVTSSYAKLIYKTPYNGYFVQFINKEATKPEEFGVIDNLQKELNTIAELNMSDYTKASQELLKAAKNKAKELPLSVPAEETKFPKLSEYKKVINQLKDAKARLQAAELDLDTKVDCGKYGSFSYNELKALEKSLNIGDFTENSLKELTELLSTPLNNDGGILIQSELNELISNAINKMANLVVRLADCSAFFQARLQAASCRDDLNKDIYLKEITVSDKSTWEKFLEDTTPKDKLPAASRRYKKIYTAASRKRVDELCDAFDKIVNISDNVSSNFPQLRPGSPVVLQSDVDLLTTELNKAIAGLELVPAPSASVYHENVTTLQNMAQTPGITEEARNEIYSILSNNYTSDMSAANEDIITVFIQAILAFLAKIRENGGLQITLADFTEYNKVRAVGADIINGYWASRYSEESINELKGALATDVYGCSVLEQATVDIATEKIREAIGNLKLREDPLTLFFIKNSDGSSSAAHTVVELKDKVCKENIDITTAVYPNSVTAGSNNLALYYIDDPEQLKCALITHKNIYFKFRSFLKNSTAVGETIETWEYSYETAGGVVGRQTVAIAHGCVYVNTDSGIEVYEPHLNEAIYDQEAVPGEVLSSDD